MMAAENISFDPDFAAPYDWAVMYRSCGLQVVPARYPMRTREDKRPKLASWKEFQDEIVGDGPFAQWFPPDAKPNMGLITGRASGNVIVIDLDEHTKDEARLWWQGVLVVNNFGIEPATWTQVTGGGGRQLFFRTPAAWHAPTNRTPIGVDVRGQGGFAMLPPSIHLSGQPYAWAPGAAPWEVDIAEAPEWLLDAIDALVDQYGGDTGSSSGGERTPNPSTDFNAFGARIDGREDALTKWVWRSIVELHRATGGVLPADNGKEAFTASLGEWLKHTKTRIPGVDNVQGLERECRGPSAFLVKWQRAAKKWDTLVAQHAAESHPGREQPRHDTDFEKDFAQAEDRAKAAPEGLYEFLDVTAIKKMRDPVWLVEGLVAENSLGFIFGPPGCLKTFIALGMGLSFAVGMPDWWNRKVERQGAVVYISSEGHTDLKFRIQAWEQRNGVLADVSPFYLIRQTINFMKADDVGRLLATVQHIAELTGVPIVAVFVDTVSRTLPGADENLQKDMTLFVAACDAVRQRFGATVVGVHHTSRTGNMRGSTVFPGAGDFLVEVHREEGAMHGHIHAAKIKAAQDGWDQHFGVETVACGDIGGHSSLVVVPIENEPEAARTAWPAHDICDAILDAVRSAWDEGEPWSPFPQTRKDGRFFVGQVESEFGLNHKIGNEIMEKWTANKVISVRTTDGHSKKRGFKVTGRISGEI